MLDPLKGIKISRYQIVLNLVPELRIYSSMLLGNSVIGERVNQIAGMTDDALRRHCGNLNRAYDCAKKSLCNPISNFGEGIRTILRCPGKILVWLGIVESNSEEKFYSGTLFKFIGWIVTFIGFISSIMTIVLGWKQFFSIFDNLIKRICRV